MVSTDSLTDYVHSTKAAIPVPFPFSKEGARDAKTIGGGLPEQYAMPTGQGGLLITRAVANWLGFLCTIQEFMDAIGAFRTYTADITYQQTALLEYMDKVGITHEVYASKNGLGDFRGHNNVGSSAWQPMDKNAWLNGQYYFN